MKRSFYPRDACIARSVPSSGVCMYVVVVVVVVVVVEIFVHGAVKATVTNAPQSQLNK